jgi:hypothetical protein
VPTKKIVNLLKNLNEDFKLNKKNCNYNSK